jgi:hypothetical protein
MNWIKKLLYKQYKENNSIVEYIFQEKEMSRIIADYIIYERKIIDLNEFIIDSYELKLNPTVLKIKIIPKDKNIINPPQVNEINISPQQSSLN